MKKTNPFNFLFKTFLIIGLFSIFFHNTLNATNPIEGKVIDAKSNKPIANVHIDILGKNISTVSDINGYFSISLPDKYNNEKLCIYTKGYQPKMYRVADFKKEYSKSNVSISQEEYLFEMQPVNSPIINEDSPKINRYNLEAGWIY